MIKTFKNMAEYQKAILAGTYLEFNCSPGWAARYAGVGRTAIHLAVDRGRLDAVKISSGGHGGPFVLLNEKQVKKVWTVSKPKE